MPDETDAIDELSDIPGAEVSSEPVTESPSLDIPTFSWGSSSVKQTELPLTFDNNAEPVNAVAFPSSSNEIIFDNGAVPVNTISAPSLPKEKYIPLSKEEQLAIQSPNLYALGKTTDYLKEGMFGKGTLSWALKKGIENFSPSLLNQVNQLGELTSFVTQNPGIVGKSLLHMIGTPLETADKAWEGLKKAWSGYDTDEKIIQRIAEDPAKVGMDALALTGMTSLGKDAIKGAAEASRVAKNILIGQKLYKPTAALDMSYRHLRNFFPSGMQNAMYEKDIKQVLKNALDEKIPWVEEGKPLLEAKLSEVGNELKDKYASSFGDIKNPLGEALAKVPRSRKGTLDFEKEQKVIDDIMQGYDAVNTTNRDLGEIKQSIYQKKANSYDTNRTPTLETKVYQQAANALKTALEETDPVANVVYKGRPMTEIGAIDSRYGNLKDVEEFHPSITRRWQKASEFTPNEKVALGMGMVVGAFLPAPLYTELAAAAFTAVTKGYRSPALQTTRINRNVRMAEQAGADVEAAKIKAQNLVESLPKSFDEIWDKMKNKKTLSKTEADKIKLTMSILSDASESMAAKPQAVPLPKNSLIETWLGESGKNVFETLIKKKGLSQSMLGMEEMSAAKGGPRSTPAPGFDLGKALGEINPIAEEQAKKAMLISPKKKKD